MKLLHILIMGLLPVALNLAYANPSGSDTIRIKAHLENLTRGEGSRNYTNPARLHAVAAYIYRQVSLYADTTHYQEFAVNGQVYKNVIASFGTGKKCMVIGAHYDVCGEQAGADDNASGVAGLLELAAMLKGKSLPYRIELVAYTLEEPPFFRTEAMGSFVHAQSVAKEEVYGVISLEMIGYFSDAKRSQQYPAAFLKAIYGSRGNYITVVKRILGGSFARKFSKKFRQRAGIKVKKFSAPRSLPGIDFSDHLNYWNFGIPAVMVTDTSFYRNPHYHTPGDTLPTLDIKRMAQVIDGVFEALVKMK